MAEQHTVTSDSAWALIDLATMGAALAGFAILWALFITAPSEGLVSPYGMAVSLVAGAYLTFVMYSYLK